MKKTEKKYLKYLTKAFQTNSSLDYGRGGLWVTSFIKLSTKDSVSCFTGTSTWWTEKWVNMETILWVKVISVSMTINKTQSPVPKDTQTLTCTDLDPGWSLVTWETKITLTIECILAGWPKAKGTVQKRCGWVKGDKTKNSFEFPVCEQKSK